MLFDNLDITSYTPCMADAIRAYEDMANDTTDMALRKLFTETYPSNISLDEVLIKCAALNQLYSTNIFSLTAMAKHIHDIINLDDRLKAGDITLIEEIANIRNVKRRFYSFATKYCAMHQPQLFSIYDSNVHRVLKHYHPYTDAFLRNYDTYRQALRSFQSAYRLDPLSPWQLDKYLWQLGKYLNN